MNKNIRTILDAIELLRGVQGCELEVTALHHKTQAMFTQEATSEDRGIRFIDTLNDDQLRTAIRLKDDRLDLYPHPCPFVVSYLKSSGRGWVLYI